MDGVVFDFNTDCKWKGGDDSRKPFCPVGDSDQFGPADNKPQRTNQDPADVHTCT